MAYMTPSLVVIGSAASTVHGTKQFAGGPDSAGLDQNSQYSLLATEGEW